ncbi:cathepsin D, isoform CRA_c, partial [Mus musculus]
LLRWIVLSCRPLLCGQYSEAGKWVLGSLPETCSDPDPSPSLGMAPRSTAPPTLAWQRPEGEQEGARGQK